MNEVLWRLLTRSQKRSEFVKLHRVLSEILLNTVPGTSIAFIAGLLHRNVWGGSDEKWFQSSAVDKILRRRET